MQRKICWALIWVLSAVAPPLAAQSVGDAVRMDSTNPQGVPVHPAAGDPAFVRWANGTTGEVKAIDSATGWFRIESFGKSGWVIKKYLTVITAEPEEPESPAAELLSYVVGTWNLEHFKDSATRGFPENTNGGPSYGPRTNADFQRIAQVITGQLSAKILILNEINGKSGEKRSVEMDRLLGHLGANWDYELTKAGGSQRMAILFDSTAARKDKCVEFEIAPQTVQGADIFARDPLACLFTFKDGSGQIKNDLIVIALHLASGQHLTANHNAAMSTLRNRLHQALQDGTFPAGEKDVLIGGDLNASRYDQKLENFWENFDSGGLKFRTLSPPDVAEYPATRLAGVPLAPRSQIDYLLASGATGGLADELVQLIAEVHEELLLGGFDDFREHVSDHIPVTVRIRVVPDVD